MMTANRNWIRHFKRLLEDRQMTAPQLARRARISDGTIYHWLDGRTFPSRKTQAKVARILGVTVEYFVFGGQP